MILSIETSTDVCSVALHNQGKLIGKDIAAGPYSHAEKLAPMIDSLLKTNKILKSDLKAVAVSAGPGSYTGLRIGTSTAKGLCYVLDIPLITIGTLESMLEGLPETTAGSLLCPMIDARRMEVYCLLGYPGGEVVSPVEAKIIDETSFAKELEEQKITFYGNGAAKCQEVITHKNATFLPDITPHAVNIGSLAYKKYLDKDFADLVYFEPEYLKAFHAIKARNPLL